MTNFADRTIWTGDNLDILRGLNSARVVIDRTKHVNLRPARMVQTDYRFPFRVLGGSTS